MENKREEHLWEQIDRLILIIAILGLIILVGLYFFIANLETFNSPFRDFVVNIIGNIDAPQRVLILNTITNIIPTSILFIGAYLIFRRIEKLRSERDADEIANRVIIKFFNILEEIKANNPSIDNGLFGLEDLRIPPDMKLSLELDVNAQIFDPKAKPQKVTVECKYRGDGFIYIKKIVYHGTNLKAREHLSDIYKIDGLNAVISEEQIKVSSGEPYIFDLILAKTKKWKKSEIESWNKKLGYLHFDIEYNGQLIKDVQKGI